MATVLEVSLNNSNFTALKAPKEITYTLSDMDASSSGRSQAGLMFRDVVAQKVKLQVQWGGLSESECATILNAIDEPFFYLRYPDAKQGAKRVMQCYVGDRTSPIFRQDTDNLWKWQGLSVSFIER